MSSKAKLSLYIGLIVVFSFYTTIVYTLTAKQDSVDVTEVMKGKMIWQEKNCLACHQIYGLGGFLGPDLTNVYSNQTKGPAYITAFVRNGTPTMPSFSLTESEMNSLLAFLQHVSASGQSNPQSFKINANGTIEGK
ncbi:MAG: cytochrome c [Bacteroidetes bacterium]|nr:cytochrome c [Bacteroidota bacterium]